MNNNTSSTAFDISPSLFDRITTFKGLSDPYIISHTSTLSSLITTPSTLFSLRAFHSLLFLSILLWLAYIILTRVLLSFIKRLIYGKSIYLCEFTTYQPPREWNISTDNFLKTSRNYGYTQDSEEFVMKILGRSGIGEESSFPPGILSNPPDLSLNATRDEAKTVIFDVIQQLFNQTGLKPKDIDILVVNCSLYVPTPSLSAMVVNHFKMREDIQSYNLGGMGCSAGVISLRLAHDLLQVYSNARALIVSTEAITPNIYVGNRKDMLVQNALFRVGGAAILLTNYKFTPKRPLRLHNNNNNNNNEQNNLNNNKDAWFTPRPMYELQTLVRCHIGSDDAAFSCVEQITDEQGNKGVKLSKDLMDVAARALRKNLTMLGPKILPWSEQIKFAVSIVRKHLHKLFNKKNKHKKLDGDDNNVDNASNKKEKSGAGEYVPNWESTIKHWCIHAGGRGVIDAIQKGMKLSDDAVSPSRNTLYRYGNTSSSSIWYEFRWLENNKKIKTGEKILQIAFGSGFKCNSAVWKRIQ